MSWGAPWGNSSWGRGTKTITFTESENRFMQSIFRTLYEDDAIRSLEGALILSILKKMETWPIAPSLTSKENNRIQYQLEKFIELMKPYPYPYYPTTFGQDTRQISVVQSIMTKIKVAQ
jgi:hypothetical protein